LTLTHFLPNLSLAFKEVSDSLWDWAKPSPSCVLVHLVKPELTWWIFYSWSFAPRRLEVAWKLSNLRVEAPRSLYYTFVLPEPSIYCLGDRCERGVDWKRSQRFCGLPQQHGCRPALMASWTMG
jgi:hypothetical protein